MKNEYIITNSNDFSSEIITVDENYNVTHTSKDINGNPQPSIYTVVMDLPRYVSRHNEDMTVERALNSYRLFWAFTEAMAQRGVETEIIYEMDNRVKTRKFLVEYNDLNDLADAYDGQKLHIYDIYESTGWTSGFNTISHLISYYETSLETR